MIVGTLKKDPGEWSFGSLFPEFVCLVFPLCSSKGRLKGSGTPHKIASELNGRRPFN
jgi:hypothetical protein